MAVLNSVMRAFAVEALPTPADLLALHSCPADLATRIDQHRQQVRQILSGDDDRLLVVIGPCSIHDPSPPSITPGGWRCWPTTIGIGCRL